MSSEDLSTYQLQLQQVEAALTADPESGELLKLKDDLQQVINLTQDLIQTQLRKQESTEDAEDVKPPAAAAASSSSSALDDLTPVKHWQVGEQCQALWNKDGLYYEARINEITTDGEVSVTFKHNRQEGVTSLGLLKVSKHGFMGTGASKGKTTKREEIEKQKEYLKKKKAKKLERFKNMEKEREDEKNKWQNFSSKAFGKKGFVKKSIFKTPENAQGRVGIGTCGVAGNSMTKFKNAEKYDKKSS